MKNEEKSIVQSMILKLREPIMNGMKKRFKALIESFKQDINRIPEDEMQKGIASKLKSQKNYWMGLYNDEGKFHYELDSNIKGEIDMEKSLNLINDLDKYIFNNYFRHLMLESVEWEINEFIIKMNFKLSLNKEEERKLEEDLSVKENIDFLNMNARTLFKDIQYILPEIRVKPDYKKRGEESEFIISCEYDF